MPSVSSHYAHLKYALSAKLRDYRGLFRRYEALKKLSPMAGSFKREREVDDIDRQSQNMRIYPHRPSHEHAMIEQGGNSSPNNMLSKAKESGNLQYWFIGL
jgi:hypothetical protein